MVSEREEEREAEIAIENLEGKKVELGWFQFQMHNRCGEWIGLSNGSERCVG